MLEYINISVKIDTNTCSFLPTPPPPSKYTTEYYYRIKTYFIWNKKKCIIYIVLGNTWNLKLKPYVITSSVFVNEPAVYFSIHWWRWFCCYTSLLNLWKRYLKRCHSHHDRSPRFVISISYPMNYFRVLHRLEMVYKTFKLSTAVHRPIVIICDSTYIF